MILWFVVVVSGYFSYLFLHLFVCDKEVNMVSCLKHSEVGRTSYRVAPGV